MRFGGQFKSFSSNLFVSLYPTCVPTYSTRIDLIIQIFQRKFKRNYQRYSTYVINTRRIIKIDIINISLFLNFNLRSKKCKIRLSIENTTELIKLVFLQIFENFIFSKLFREEICKLKVKHLNVTNQYSELSVVPILFISFHVCIGKKSS